MLPWSAAMQQALYGEHGFYRDEHHPRDHYRTSVHASPLYAQALARLVVESDALLGHPQTLDIVDLGAADGSLLSSLVTSLPDDLRVRTRPVGVELRPRPPVCPREIEWTAEFPRDVTGVILANEWLDNIPVDAVELTDDGLREVLVNPMTGAEELGAAPNTEQRAWLERWWPLQEHGTRAEIGFSRDDTWSDVLEGLKRGLAVAMDYSHSLDQRRSGTFPLGTLTGFRAGQQTHPVPDGSCDITAHVALDACAATSQGEATATLLTTQRAALTALGIHSGLPPAALATDDPVKYMTQLARSSEATELTDRSGLGSFGWLAQTRGIPLPPSLTAREVDTPS